MPRQLRLDFGTPDIPPADKLQPVQVRLDAIGKIAESLRPRLIEHLRCAAGDVTLRELQAALGHPAKGLDRDPQSNPVNFLLKQMRDAGEVTCHDAHWGEPTFSLPDAERIRLSPPLVRPDRQIIYESDDPQDWPKPVYDPESITVDRPHRDIDGPPHRFAIHCADYVEVLVSSNASSDDIRIGEVLEIDHLRCRVLVRFPEHELEEAWFSVEQVFPTVEEP